MMAVSVLVELLLELAVDDEDAELVERVVQVVERVELGALARLGRLLAWLSHVLALELGLQVGEELDSVDFAREHVAVEEIGRLKAEEASVRS